MGGPVAALEPRVSLVRLQWCAQCTRTVLTLRRDAFVTFKRRGELCIPYQSITVGSLLSMTPSRLHIPWVPTIKKKAISMRIRAVVGAGRRWWRWRLFSGFQSLAEGDLRYDAYSQAWLSLSEMSSGRWMLELNVTARLAYVSKVNTVP